jgi:hypothetical protein
MLKCSGELAFFERACRRVRQTQANVLRQTLQENRNTWIGRRYRFATIDSPRAFQKAVPLAIYDDYAPLVDRIAAGESRVLTSAPVLLLEPTSGTTGGTKLIPYTAGLRRQFQRGVAAWIADLFFHRAAVRAGRAYWSLSPAMGPPRRSSGGLPIGFDDDAAYLGWLEQFALRKLLVIRNDVVPCADMMTFRHTTLQCMLAASDLSLISVWSPTFLTALLAVLADPETQARAVAGLGQHLQEIWRSSATLPEKLHATWPKLAIISCWTDAAAGQFVPELRQCFPKVEIQPKGLLATEGFVSFPLVDQPGAALALRSHFFEFEEAASGRFLLAHQLERGGLYRVIVTTAGGLYRYQLRDEIEVVGFHQQCPLLRFIGKCDLVSDLVGEKLAEEHVRAILNRLPAPGGITPRFQLVVPVLHQPPRYRLYMQVNLRFTDFQSFLQKELQLGLEENPYYRHAVAAGQLAPVEVVLLDDRESAWLIYESRCLERGQKAGDIKPVALDRWTGWPERFAALAPNADRVGDNRSNPGSRP